MEDEKDREIHKRFAQLMEANPELARDYLLRPNGGLPAERELGARDAEAVEKVHAALVREEATAKVATAQLLAGAREQTATDIVTVMHEPAYTDKSHPYQKAAVDRVASLYQQLNTP